MTRWRLNPAERRKTGMGVDVVTIYDYLAADMSASRARIWMASKDTLERDLQYTAVQSSITPP